MSYNSILIRSKKMRFHTDMKLVFDALNGLQNNYNWLITDIDLNYIPQELVKYSYEGYIEKNILITGEELTKIVYDNDIQFMWAVFSAFEKGIEIDVDNLEVEPYADGNPDFWIVEPKIQHPLATMEIVCWDCTYTIFLSRYKELNNLFENYFVELENLNKYNQRNINF